MRTTTDTTSPDAIEARVRRRMAAVTKARGFDTQRERNAELARIDALLDAWNQTRPPSED